MTEPGGDRAAVVALLRVRPDKLTWPEITTEVVEVGSAVAVWEGHASRRHGRGGSRSGSRRHRAVGEPGAQVPYDPRRGRPGQALPGRRDEALGRRGGGRMVTAWRLEPVPGTAFAGIWGGVTRAAARARHLPRTDGRPGQVGTADGRNAQSQRLDRVLPARFLNAPAWSRHPRRLPTSGSARSRATRPGEPRKPRAARPGPAAAPPASCCCSPGCVRLHERRRPRPPGVDPRTIGLSSRWGQLDTWHVAGAGERRFAGAVLRRAPQDNRLPGRPVRPLAWFRTAGARPLLRFR